MKTTTLAAWTLLGLAQPALANIDIQFDYGYDTGNYFTGVNAGRQAALNAAASLFESRLTDTLGAITVADQLGILFLNPANPTAAEEISLSHQTIATNVIRVYVGGYSATDSTLGYGGPGGYSCIVCDRGQGNTSGDSATDFGPWGGAISFNFYPSTNWNFGTGNPASSQHDFYSVAVHELGHVLGFGTADSFMSKVEEDHWFMGNASGSVKLDSYDAHWTDGTMSTSNGIAQEAAMTPYVTNGERKYFTELDFDGLKDIGWQVSAVPEPETWAMFIAGLGLLGFVARRRRAYSPTISR